MGVGLTCLALDAGSVRADATGAAKPTSPTARRETNHAVAAPSGAQPPASNEASVQKAELADVDPDNDREVGPPALVADCEQRLNAAGIEYKPAKLPIRKRRNGPVCGAEQAVVYQRGPSRIRYSSAPLLTCGMALALADFEAIVTEESVKHLGQRVVSVSHAGTYSCRQMARFQSLVSEHSYANAIDIRSFRLETGRSISVLRDFSKTGTAASKFLHAVARRLYDENVFSVVLTEYFDKLHRDHFHLDLARYRVNGTRRQLECGCDPNLDECDCI